MTLITLAGAGPGDPELLTIKAWRRLQAAEVVVVDRLVSAGVLDLIPTGVERITAGKQCNRHTLTQEEINALLVQLGREGRRTVRLKGGDPYIFGRGGEEAEALAAAGLPYEVIPGITAAQGCGALAGIPLTHRVLATSVRLLTGHRQANGALNHDWAGLADPHTTLVIYMGLHTLPEISMQLMAHGRAPNTPAAAIHNATLPDQRTILSTLADLPAAVAQAALPAPVTIIIGAVVQLAGRLAGDYMGDIPSHP